VPVNQPPRPRADSRRTPDNRDGRDGDDDRRTRRDRRRRGGTSGSVGYGFYWPYVVPTQVAPGLVAPAPAGTPIDPDGFLRLVVAPRHTGVIVDGIYEGTVDDFGGTGERSFEAGVHHVRLEAPGYEPVEFDVRVPAGDTITLRRDLYPMPEPPRIRDTAAPSTATNAAPRTLYVIPRCYLGDVKPRQEDLPAQCALSDLRTLD
jgi:hypothetical protein